MKLAREIILGALGYVLITLISLSFLALLADEVMAIEPLVTQEQMNQIEMQDQLNRIELNQRRMRHGQAYGKTYGNTYGIQQAPQQSAPVKLAPGGAGYNGPYIPVDPQERIRIDCAMGHADFDDYRECVTLLTTKSKER